MWALLAAIVINLSIVLICDNLARKKNISDELSRKIPHTVTALSYVLLVFLIDIRLLTYAATASMIGAVIAHKFNLFAHARRVERKTWGEFFFPAAVIASSLLTNNKWVFAAAILHLGIADTLAALIGQKYGRKHTYKIAGHTKTLAGSLAFWLTSLLITALALQQLDVSAQIFWPTIFWLPLTLTVAENAGVYGLDNLTVPLLAVATLNSLQFI